MNEAYLIIGWIVIGIPIARLYERVVDTIIIANPKFSQVGKGIVVILWPLCGLVILGWGLYRLLNYLLGFLGSKV